MYCEFCGKQIDEDTAFCPFCGQRQENHVGRKTQKHAMSEQDKQKQRAHGGREFKARYAIASVVILFLLTCTVLYFQNHFHKEGDLGVAANEIVEAFEEGDASAIQAAVFGSDNQESDREMDDYFGTSKDTNETGILEMIFIEDIITVSEIDESVGNITYKITAPDMTELFHEISDDVNNMDDDEFCQYVENYINETDRITTTVAVNYTYSDGMFAADYTTREFVNAISGGLLDAYQDLYQEMIDEYLENMEETE